MRPLERKRTQTEVGLTKQSKANFLPRLKESYIKKEKSPQKKE